MADAEDPRRPEPLDSAVRIVLLFQAFIGGLAILIIGLSLFWNIDDAYLPPHYPPSHPNYSPDVYPLLRQLFLAVLAAMIIYILLVQWNDSKLRPGVTAKLELAKGLLVTAIWLWLLLDSIFYIPRYWYHYSDPYLRYRRKRIIFTATSFMVPCS
jgi:hypothetical protein